MTETPIHPPDGRINALGPEQLGTDPIDAFREWFAHAEAHSVMSYPNACTLSTVDADGMPGGRVVLLKGVDARGFVFYSNYRSAKARALQANPRAALTFHWDSLGRQVRVRGPVETVGSEESDAYFAGRPLPSRLGAWASEQSQPLASREALEARLEEVTSRFADGIVPRPPHWGGYLLRPLEVEFWSAGEARLHDRFLFRRAPGSDHWSRVRLNP